MVRHFAFAAALLAAAPASAADLTFTGNFGRDDNVLLFNFSIASAQTVGIRSTSWQSPDGGGFDPILYIADSAGNIIQSQDDGSLTGTLTVNGMTYNYGAYDSFFDVALAAGNYTAIITQYANFANTGNIAGGFSKDGNPNFTFDEGYGGATQPMFNGVWDDNDPRTSFWRFHLLNVDSVTVVDPNPVPAPGALGLFGLALAALVVQKRRRA
jgi:MYXO-CTERM domain-containing protein